MIKIKLISSLSTYTFWVQNRLLRVFLNFLRAKRNDFFWKHCRKFPHFLVILMILFTAEPLRFFIYISVCCWTFELSLLLNLWDYALDYVSVYCWTFGFSLMLNLWIFSTAEHLRLCPAYRVLQTIQMKLILLCVWAERAVLGSAKIALNFK